MIIKRVIDYFQSVRINRDFPRYEQESLIRHKEQAEIKYSISKYKIEINTLLSKITLQSKDKFGNLIEDKTNKIKQYKDEVDENEIKLSFFTRFYKEELEKQYEEKHILVADKENLIEKKEKLDFSISHKFKEKNEAYENLTMCKNEIKAWHKKSKRSQWLLGNSGKKIPKHSLFGQSFGDLESYQDEQNRIYEEIQDINNETNNLKQKQQNLSSNIRNINHKITTLVNEINNTKNDRSKMYKLKTDGYDKKTLQITLDKLNKNINDISIELANIKLQRDEYINSEKNKYGVIELELKISDLVKKKAVFIKSFDSEKNQKKRREVHKQLWQSR